MCPMEFERRLKIELETAFLLGNYAERKNT